MKMKTSFTMVSVIAVLFACAFPLRGARPVGNEKSSKQAVRQFLTEHGFEMKEYDPNILARKHVPLKDIAADLGFSNEDLWPIPSQPRFSDIRPVEAHGIYFIVESEIRDEQGEIVPGSLGNPSAVCTVTASLYLVLQRAHRYLRTESFPKMSIKSFTVPKDRKQPLMIVFELAADGVTPVAISQDQFSVTLSMDQETNRFDGRASFAKKAPKVYTVRPHRPVTLTVSTYKSDMGRGNWSDLHSGKYSLRVCIHSGKTAEFDYHWLGMAYSDDREIEIK